MFKPVDIKALADYKIWVRFADGIEGEVDLSHLAGRGVFSLWRDYAEFQKVHIGPGGAIAWNAEVELCPDSIYLELTGKTPEEVFPNLRMTVLAGEGAHAVVLAPEIEGPIRLAPADERELLEAMEEIRRGESEDSEELLNELRADAMQR
jgi:uncharacterized protein DUF2442